MWLMLQQPASEDFILATGETHPVREFVEKAFRELGMEIQFVDLPPSFLSSISWE
jgi:GDPmannose 4,6-dehydratase